MPRLTGNAIAQEYAPGKRENSFYQEQVFGDKIDGDYILKHSKSTMLHYDAIGTECIQTQETSFMG